MNEQSTKKILFNKSTLISLKAELLRKREEVKEKKQLPQSKIENFKPPHPKHSDKNDDTSKPKKTFRDSLKAIDLAEMEAIRKSKAALEKKAEIYEHLSDKAGTSQLAGEFLVDFNTKKRNETQTQSQSSPLNEPENLDCDGNDWTEFTDCLGRTRKCLKSDLELYRAKDRELQRATNREKPEDEPKIQMEETVIEKPFLVQKTNDYLQSLRVKWEEKERDLLAKDKDIHYQDVLFDEARMHGVSYFSFSTDEAERRKQMEDLLKEREVTVKAQKEAEEKRKKREDLLAARVAAARARQRLRAGLPPEDPEEQNRKDFTARLLEFLTEQKNEADAKAKEEERKQREAKELERQKLREAYVREWDIGKDGVSEVKRFKEMTQEEYVEQQRSKRINEFAPPRTATSSKSNFAFDDKGKIIEPDSANKTWADVRPKPATPPPPIISDFEEPKGLYFSTKSDPKVLYKNFVRPQEPTAIVNEVENYAESRNSATERTQDDSHAEIAPPPTYDYYGPVATRRPRQDKPFESDIREAYEQGVQSLRKEPSNRKLPPHYDFTME